MANTQAALDHALAAANAEVAAKARRGYGTVAATAAYPALPASPNVAAPPTALPEEHSMPALVVAHYAQILGVTPKLALEIVRMSLGKLRHVTNAANYFQRKHNALPATAYVPAIADATRATIAGVACRLLKKGAYGSAWHGHDGAVYKVITISDMDDGNFREVFVESLIQTLLQTDSEYGHHIARLEKLYKISGAEVGFVCKMEHIRHTLDTYMTDVVGVPASLAAIRPVFTTIGTVLNGLQQKYGFQHRDLHGGNVMFAADGTFKLIDFGQSCVVLEGHTYARNNAVCEAYDPLIFLAYLYGYKWTWFQEDAKQRIREYFTGTDGKNWFKFVETWLNSHYLVDHSGHRSLNPAYRPPPLSATFHYFYHTYSINYALTAPDSHKATPWGMSHGAGRPRHITEFLGGGMPRRGTYDFFARAWGAALPHAGGARRTRRRAKVSSA